jgi:hypothetical protein
VAGRPLVSIGVPTYNRAAGLERAVASVLAQTYDDWELLISDNASSDTTPQVARRLADSDERITLVSHPFNMGPTGNFNHVLTGRRGEYVLILADDDWLSPNYLEECVAALEREPDLALAVGADVYHKDGAERARGAATDILHPSPARRVSAYYGQVFFNATFYGVMRRSAVEPALPMGNGLGNDWVLVASVAAAGKIRTLPRATLFRSLGGSSVDWQRLAQISGLTPAQVRHPHVQILKRNVGAVARHGAAFAALGRPRRTLLGLVVAAQIVRRRPVEMLVDAFAPLFERPALRPVQRALSSLYWRLRPPEERPGGGS